MVDPAPPPLPLQQSPIYLAALARLGVPASLHPLPGGAVLVLSRKLAGLGRVALISRPVTLLPAGLRRALAAQVLIVNAETPDQATALARAGFIRLSRGRTVAALSLAGRPEDWLARMDGKWRNRLRHGHRQGLVVGRSALPPDPNHWLFHREAAQQAARGYRNLPPALVVAMAAATPGALQLFTARRDGRTLAAMLFARHEGAATYLIGWSGAEGRAASAHNLLLWQAMGDLRAQGAGVIDLGHCDDRGAPGLARFKRGSGARLRRLGGTWAEIAPLAPLHALLRAARRVSEPMPDTARTCPEAARCTGHAESS